MTPGHPTATHTAQLLGGQSPRYADTDPETIAQLLAPDSDEEIEWKDDALCAQVDPEVFFPEKGGSTRIAKQICRECPVRIECLAYAMDNDERFGIWGGLSERERRQRKRDQVAAA